MTLRRDWNRIGHLAHAEQPAKPKGRRGPKPYPIDPDAVAEALADLDARASAPKPIPTGGGSTLPAIGRCHDCNRTVSGERRYCGPCLAKHRL